MSLGQNLLRVLIKKRVRFRELTTNHELFWAYNNFIRVLGGFINGGGGGGLLTGWAYKQNLKKMFRNDEVKRIIYNTFIVRRNKRRIYFKNIYKTELCDWNNRDEKK